MLAKLAVGGMAEIFLVRGAAMTGVERYCVLKRILPEHAGNAQFVQMFLDEARIATLLQHPNIASVYDIGMLGDSYFYTMEYVHGATVRSLLERAQELQRPLPLACVSTIVAAVAAALHHAHERNSNDGRPLGIVHRDVSPSNIMVSYEGHVKLVDFGVAKANRPVETRSGMVKGKISYLSPEQCHGERVDRRSDLFSLGIVLWEMLTGARLYRRGTDFENMGAIVHERPPRPSARRPEIPDAIDDIAARLLAKSVTERFQTAAELVEAIENASMRVGTMLSTAAVGRLVHDLFGARAEPWLELERDRRLANAVTLVSRPIPKQIAESLIELGSHEFAAIELTASSLQITSEYACVLPGEREIPAPATTGPGTVSLEVSGSVIELARAHPGAPPRLEAAAATATLLDRPTLLGVPPPVSGSGGPPPRAPRSMVRAAPVRAGSTISRRSARSRLLGLAAAAALIAIVIGVTARSPAVPRGSVEHVAAGPADAGEARDAPSLAKAALPVESRASIGPPPSDAAPAQAAPAAAPPGTPAPVDAPPRDAEPAAPPRDATPARHVANPRPTRAAPADTASRGSAGKAPPAARSADPSSESLQALVDARNYARVVSACSETIVTAAIASICALAACHVHDTIKAQYWLSICPAESRDRLAEDCRRSGNKPIQPPALDCSNDPLDCR
jgi:serine/threonine protein kinase